MTFVNVVAKTFMLFVVLSIVHVFILYLYTPEAVTSGFLICIVCDICNKVSRFFASVIVLCGASVINIFDSPPP